MIDLAMLYQAQGWSIVPIPRAGDKCWESPSLSNIPPHRRGKIPIHREWQNFRLNTEERLRGYFSKRDDKNIGLLLGEPSDWIVDIDLDCDEAVVLAPQFLPETLQFGRPSKPNSHHLFRCVGATTEKWQIGKEMLLELRANGQTVLPGSIHPSGERIDWTDGYVAPLPIEFATLKAACEAIAKEIYAIRGIPLPAPSAPQKRTIKDTSYSNYDEAVSNFNSSFELPKQCPACNRKDAFKIKGEKWFCHHSGHPDELGGKGRGCFVGDAVDLASWSAGKERGEFLRSEGWLSEHQQREEPPPIDDEYLMCTPPFG